MRFYSIFERFFILLIMQCSIFFGMFMFADTSRKKYRDRFLLRCVIIGASIFCFTVASAVLYIFFQNWVIQFITHIICSITPLCAFLLLFKNKMNRVVYGWLSTVLLYFAAECCLRYILRFVHLPLYAELLIKILFVALFFLAHWFVATKKIKNDDLFNPECRLLITYYIAFSFALPIAYVEYYVYDSVLWFTFLCAIELCLELFFSILFYQVYISYRKVFDYEMERMLLKKRCEQTDNFLELVERINIKNHDLKKELRVIQNYGLNGVTNELKNITSEYDCYFNTGNDTLDTLLTEAGFRCKNEKIELSCIIDGKKLEFLSSTEIVGIFGNAIDNAIEYLRQRDYENKFIHLSLTDKSGFIAIVIENSYFGGLKTYS